MKPTTMKRKLPESFTNPDSLFEMSSVSFRTWESCRTYVLGCKLLTVPTIYLQWWWGVPVLIFVGLVASSIAGAIEQKAGTGYPYLEPGDAVGLVFAGFFYFVLSALLFWGSFSLPTDGWDNIFSGDISSKSTTPPSKSDTNG